MNQFQLICSLPTYTTVDSAIRLPICGNYDYWTALIQYFLPKADTIEIHCWNDEIETIKDVEVLFEEKKYEENLTIFRGENDSVLTDYLLKEHLNRFGEFKWFTLNLYLNIASVFHSGHWSTELYVPNATEGDISFIKSVMPAEAIFDLY
ncbi:hypothetical protein EKG37_07105 [Robertmurraya yapensis]|uniref:Uncharacterized protein n=2 Tax=Bacillaceae TaxID=186817 RepID=A0A431WEM0_9BACI|nr:hypothetical protein [Bacillus yapensis]RTR33973.1 hypothetical protein EKG37_07105 [Bacillus yapensis]TKS97291.1 hypothetical protein FAR12_07105 [Bacillus yapensis]